MNQASEKKQAWWQLLSIQTGGTICLPVIMIGQLVCQKFGWLAALLGIGLGNAFLLAIGYLLASLGTFRPQSTVEHAVTYFGKRGRALFASLMMLSMLGWFAIQLNIMSLSCKQLFDLWGIPIPNFMLNIGLGLLIACVMCFGMQAMKGLSYFSAPLLVLILLYATFSIEEPMPTAASFTLSWIAGLSLIVGANIAAVIDLPTYFRHARSSRDAKICIVWLYGLIVPLIELVGVYLSAVKGGDSILDVLQAGHGQGWMMGTSCFVLLSGWATNNANLYSALTSSYALSARWTPVTRTLILGGMGTAMACFNPLGNMEEVLDLLGVTTGGMGAVILGNYLLERYRSTYQSLPSISLLSWSMGMSIGLFAALFHWSMTGVPALDAFMASLVIQLTLNPIYQRKELYEAIDG
jgi:purine-cytosine permease-like protein